jgi:hypothetical protein
LEAMNASDVRGKKGRDVERRQKERGGRFNGCVRKKRVADWNERRGCARELRLCERRKGAIMGMRSRE